jgi:hypothetical protein
MLGYPPALGAQPFAGKLPNLANGQPFLNQLEPVVDSQLQGNRSVFKYINKKYDVKTSTSSELTITK